MSADTTQELERGYWPSYNVPYFEDVYNRTGYGMLRAHLSARGPDFNEVVTGLSYQLASRAKILRRDSGERPCDSDEIPGDKERDQFKFWIWIPESG